VYENSLLYFVAVRFFLLHFPLLTVVCSTGAGVGREVLAWEAKAREKV
jgi:hypothetical protein